MTERLAGTIELKDHGIEVVKADDTALVSLAILAGYNPRALHVSADRITFGYPVMVTYRVVGWDAESAALIVERED